MGKEYSSLSFAQAIKSKLYDYMPLEDSATFREKHKSRIGRMRDLALGNNNVVPMPNGAFFFDLGNTVAEVNTPQYHILEDSEVIHKRGLGTTKSRGSQAKVLPSQRDYGKWTKSIVVDKNTGEVKNTRWVQEYRKNNRGSRSKLKTVGGVTTKISQSSTTYANTHYHYIEKFLANNIESIASEFGLKKKSVGGDNNRSEIDLQIKTDNENKSKAFSKMLEESKTY